jgi:hypothetical protein
MKTESCPQIADLLVPYCDGELSADDRRRVEAHLAACPECRSEIGVLGRSLELAQSIWQESAAALSSPHPFTPSSPHPVIASPRHRRLIPAALAGVAAAALVAVGTWLAWRPERGNQLTQQTAVTPSPRHPVAPSPPHPVIAAAPEEIDVEEYIAREGRKARLQASIAILATEPSLKEYKERAERYLAEAYPEAAPGRRMPAVPLQVPRKETKS